ncbi:MAG: Hpt domain-containing protein [Nitrospirae bacterium]|nr:Hpt domain-containing protein [Nitrospirota bacterium]MBF0536284.1 Hpt domain-containing protein [Nitrospirota bacterium]MBF0618226.1 Hpt domain-containing protein [Nitrospirota bacterium]
MTENNDSGEIIVEVEEDLTDLMPRYMEHRRKDIKAIHKAMEESDFEAIRGMGHSMKGSGGGFGCDEITDIGDRMEIAAKEKNSGLIMELTHQLSSYLDRVRVVSIPNKDI